ncbi:MAG: phytanoyl-CoA dioxygenase family protein, partial [Alphaproteobacteria bacterium]|nr:phytanoyl-CoA dioxygenase family protein [Alphaproteobacteria bacterium]
MLSAEQKSRYNRDGYILLEGVLSAPDLAALRRVTDEFVEKSRQVRVSDDVFDVAEDHSAAHPRLRRIKKPDSLHSEYAKLARHPAIVTALDELWEGRGVRFKTSKLNTKLAGSGEAIEWHQDWAFYPHTNSDLVAVGVMLDD